MLLFSLKRECSFGGRKFTTRQAAENSKRYRYIKSLKDMPGAYGHIFQCPVCSRFHVEWDDYSEWLDQAVADYYSRIKE